MVFVIPQDSFIAKGLPLAASFLVLPPWIWMAMRTKHCLQVITMGSIPFQKRTILLMKILAIIVGIGGIFGVVLQLGMPWLLAALPAGIALVFALTEHVQEVIPPKPDQAHSAYQSSWEEYRRLRTDYVRSWRWFGASILILILSTVFRDKMPATLEIGVFAFAVFAILASTGFMAVKQLKWFRWHCPRCGCAFRGFWGRPSLPKKCAYCGLPREDRALN